jgi:hypothetical protein
MSKIEVNTIETASGSTLTVGKSGDTVTLASGASQSGFKAIDFQTVITADGSTTTTAEAGKGYIIDVSSAAHTINLPSSPSAGDEVAVLQYGSNTITVGRNGSNINGNATDDSVERNGALHYVYSSSASIGWAKVNRDSTSSFVEATGGTVTTSGDFKIHTFNSTSNFVVSALSGTSANNEVSYVVVAGGGSSGNNVGAEKGTGGGGAGGFRESKSGVDSYTASPLEGSTNITVTQSTYPITVGAGGAASPSDANNGSPSVFSTVTSAGGGHGGKGTGGSGGSNHAGQPGGSGGGSTKGGTAGSGNTPPVSPSQGSNGGTSAEPTGEGGAGGGGATAVGGNVPGTGGAGGAGGAGATTSISGTPTAYAGGGGGGSNSGAPDGGSTGGAGGTGGGGTGSDSHTQNGTAGSANTGGGGGGRGGAQPTSGSNAGGSGVVIIRYKYQ